MKERFQTFTVLIAKINRCIYKIKAEGMSEFELKSSHVSCLYYLYRQNALTAKGLCDASGEDKANISRSLKYLEENGYLKCEAKSQKRYQSPLILTEKGKEMGKWIVERIDGILNVSSQGLSSEDLTTMYRALDVIYNNLNRICDGYSSREENYD